jgi:hypothetical protein
MTGVAVAWPAGCRLASFVAFAPVVIEASSQAAAATTADIGGGEGSEGVRVKAGTRARQNRGRTLSLPRSATA